MLAELKEYATEVDVDFVRKAVRAIGRCAIKVEVRKTFSHSYQELYLSRNIEADRSYRRIKILHLYFITFIYIYITINNTIDSQIFGHTCDFNDSFILMSIDIAVSH